MTNDPNHEAAEEAQADDAAQAAREHHAAQCDEIRRRFAYHRPIPGNEDHDADQLAIESLRETFAQTAEQVILKTPPGRDQAEALTQLEQASFVAIGAIAREWPIAVDPLPGRPTLNN